MNKAKVFSHFSKIIDTMIDNSLFFKTFWQHPYSSETFEGSIDDPALPENVNIFFGASRGCIYNTDYDYVVKFDIDSDSYGDSLCLRECEIYEAAQRAGVAQYFTEPTYLGTYRRTIQFYNFYEIERYLDWIDYDPIQFDQDFARVEEHFDAPHSIIIEVPLYAYPRVDRYSFTFLKDEESKVYESQINCVNSPLRGRSKQIAIEFVFRYGMEEYKKLSDFMREWNINDIHYGNVGDFHHSLCILDFAGWHSSYSEENYSTDISLFN